VQVGTEDGLPDETPVFITLASQQANHLIHIQMCMEVHHNLHTTPHTIMAAALLLSIAASRLQL